MSQIIASTYELQQKLGSGGGGVVYLARHLRLEKPVVLKADKRKITTNPELLRREVDVLKNLSHPYIPQVYDFFVENDTVYSVIEYIQGESLDKPLSEGVRFPQSQVIQWARQLLEAVVYLHSPIHGNPPRGYVHADIKPANIMCRPNGDICLIDFNIALAIGEENVVGASGGYASPEHYGLDYSSHGLGTKAAVYGSQDGQTAELPKPDEKQSVIGQRKIVPDERSDIYSIGATLYHLFSGRRPPKSALEVQPLTTKEASQQICEIITKAMQPNPDLRYQTASEMLNAFEHLWENDRRSRRIWKIRTALYVSLAACFLIGGLLAFRGSRMLEHEQAQARLIAEQAEEQERAARLQAEENEQKERLAKEAEAAAKNREQQEKEALQSISDGQEALERGDTSTALMLALEALEKQTIYESRAQYLLTEALGVYQLSTDYTDHCLIPLETTPFQVGLSPAGTKAFALCRWEMSVYDTESGTELAALAITNSACAKAVFLGENRIVYAGKDGLSCYDLAEQRTLWNGEAATAIAVSGDGGVIAAVDRDAPEAKIYTSETGELLRTVSFEGHRQWVPVNDAYLDDGGNLLCLNQEGTFLAASFSDGSVAIYDTQSGAKREEILDPNDYLWFDGGFYQDYFVVSGSRGSHDPLLAVADLKDRSRDYYGYITSPAVYVQADDNGVFFASGNTVVQLDPESRMQTEVAYTMDEDAIAFLSVGGYTVVGTEKGFQFFAENAALLSNTGTEYHCSFVFLSGETALIGGQDVPFLRIRKFNRHSEAQLIRYNPDFQHREARLSADEKTVMLFRRDAYQIYSADGKLITEGVFPDEEQIYDHQYRRQDGESWVEVFYYDGLIRRYSSADGSLLSEEKGNPYDKSLEEDFYTDQFHIHTTPRQPPQVFDRKTETYLGMLEEENDLTYVTQVGDYFIAEYISTRGERYGLLMNERLEALARLPMLCDVVNGKLVFDYPTGDLRKCSVYSLDDLMTLGKEQP